jgi:hypothetical protein
VIKLGVLPVRSLLLVEGALWAASGGQVFMASVETHTIEVSAAKPTLLLPAGDGMHPQCEWQEPVGHSGAMCKT